ncbi:MAG TPA: DUF6390 family protein [Modestobacter sp.]|nr:DUF6390 family protein [Modestobacter sp.]
MAATPGVAQFARYAYPPNDLGHCGPPGAEVLLAGGATGRDGPGLRPHLARFEGAWPYLRLLAATAGVEDPLDPAVVAAYWLGGELLDAVPSPAFRAAVERDFGAQPGVRERLAHLAGGRGGPGAAPDHAFHVFVVYPWVGLLGSAGDVPRAVLDSCRVRWGTVVAVDGESAVVRSPPLSWDGAALGLGAEELVCCRWAQDEQAFVADLRPGDQVSLHWNWICERLDDQQVAVLSGRTGQQLRLTNEWLARRHRTPADPLIDLPATVSGRTTYPRRSS